MARLALLLAFLTLSSDALALEVGAVVDSVVDAYGGFPAVERMEAFRVDALVRTPMHAGPGRERRDFQAPDRFRVEIVYPDATEVRILDAGGARQGNEHELQPAGELARASMAYEMLRSTVPWSLLWNRTRLQDGGTKTAGGVECFLLVLPWSTNLDLIFWVDAQTRRVVQAEGALRAEGMQMTFATRFEDFRRDKGPLYAFREENFAAGEHIATTEVLDVTFSPKTPGPPEGKP